MEHYGTSSGFIAYCNERGIHIPNNNPTVISENLLVGSEWLDAVYRSSFPGVKVGGREQIREWSRKNAVDVYGNLIPSNEIPREVIYASYEAAIQNMVQPGSLSLNYTPPKYKSVSVHGAISVQYSQYDNVRELQMEFIKIDRWLSTILITNPDSTGLVGSVYRT